MVPGLADAAGVSFQSVTKQDVTFRVDF